MKKLIRLQFLKFRRSSSKMELFGKLYLLALVWFFEIALMVKLRGDGSPGPGGSVGAFLALCIIAGVADVVFKVFFKHDATVMDPFLRTRPVPKRLWERFLIVSQFWNGDNLMIPLIVLPLCVGMFRFPWGIAAWIVVYLLSVTAGIFIMEFKRGPDYDEQKTRKVSKAARSRIKDNVFGIQTRSVMRSKRLKTMIIFLGLLMLFNFWNVSNLSSVSDTKGFALDLMMLVTVLCIPMVVGQYGFGIEANCFNAIWTKPLAISRILRDKYYFLGLLTTGLGVLCAVICAFTDASFLTLAGGVLYSAGFANLILLLDACNCTRFDLFGKAFFNYQGAATTFRAVMFAVTFGTMILGVLPLALLDGWAEAAVLGGMGIAGFALHRPALRWVEGRFLKDRYKYMEKYMSK